MLYLHGGAEAVNKTYRNAAIKREINILEDNKKSASSEYERIMLSNKIKYLEESLEDEVDNKLNQDKLLEEAKSYLEYTITKPISNLYGLDSTLLAS
jgi:predicted  nucleic acid-binding Zn-ribbon protein